MAVTPHGVLPRDSHEFSPTIGGVHKLLILLEDLLEDNLQKIFGEEMGGVRGTPTPLYLLQNPIRKEHSNLYQTEESSSTRINPHVERKHWFDTHTVSCLVLP